MAIAERATKRDVVTEGVSQPWAGPLYSQVACFYRGIGVIFALWEADTEKVAELLPPGIEPLKDPVVCGAWISPVSFSTFGPYNEALLQVQVLCQGTAYSYIPFIYADNDMAMAAGREVWGCGKKFANMKLDWGGGNGLGYREQFVFTLDRPANKRLLTVNLSCDRPAEMAELPSLPALNLRTIPNCEAGKPPSVCELVRFDAEMIPKRAADGTADVWAGRCSVTMDSASEHDPLYKMAPTRMLAGFYGTFDWGNPGGKLIKNYLS